MNEWATGYPGALVKAGETLEREFEERLRDSSTLAFRVAYGVLRRREDAEDVAQEALARAFRHFPKLRDREKFRSWLVRTAWRLSIDRYRSDRRRSAREEAAVPAESPGATAEEEAEAGERARHLWNAIDALPEKLRVVIVLSAIEEHDVREVARLLDLPEGTVKSRLFLARKGLAESLRWLVSNLPAR
jgi:RNA polymerase sigma-70 factor (ECF subfamily)